MHNIIMTLSFFYFLMNFHKILDSFKRIKSGWKIFFVKIKKSFYHFFYFFNKNRVSSAAKKIEEILSNSTRFYKIFLLSNSPVSKFYELWNTALMDFWIFFSDHIYYFPSFRESPQSHRITRTYDFVNLVSDILLQDTLKFYGL